MGSSAHPRTSSIFFTVVEADQVNPLKENICAYCDACDKHMRMIQWTVEDVVAWLAYLQRQFDPEALAMGQLNNYVLFQTLAAVYPTQYLAMFSDLRWLNDPSAQTMIPPPAAAAKRMVADSIPALPTTTAAHCGQRL